MNRIKISAVVMTLIMLALFLPCFYADAEIDTTPYYIDELSMTIDVPSKSSVISSSVKKSDTLFEDGTFDYISIMTKMRDDHALLYGRNKADSYDIEIIGYENEEHIKDLSKVSEKKQAKLLQKYGEQEDIVESKTYSNGKMCFFFSSRTLNNASGRYFYCDYYTIYNGNNITIRIISSNDNINQSELEILKAMADSIEFPSKRKIQLSALQGKGVFVAFIIISVLFVLVILYRRHDEKVNKLLLEKASLIKQRLDKGKDESETVQPSAASETEQSGEPGEEIGQKDASDKKNADDLSEEDDEDLSSIDLDAAIALFDDSKE